VILSELITVERDGPVLLIGVNRPAKRNAVNLATMDAELATQRLSALRAIVTQSERRGRHRPAIPIQ
jgi:enoyl-CoA hydratase/carnithine racemase